MLKVFVVLSFYLAIGCSNGTPSFSLLADQDNFLQNAHNATTKIDILWVIDNSGSMRTSQDTLAANFESFIAGIRDRNLDFQMAVTTTEAYRAAYTTPSIAKFRDGTDATNHTGIFVVTPQTPNFEDVFITNALQGTTGYGDERAFSSFKEALNSNLNAGFLRPDAFLSVIIVSDEEDFSHNSSSFTESYSYPGLHTVQSYVDYLDTITGSSPDIKKYSVSAMAIFDEPCRLTLNDSFPGRKIGLRYKELVEATNGITGSLCQDFAVQLEQISNQILSLATQFYLSRIPIEETISVIIDGLTINEISGSNPTNGWTYNAENNSIIFYGTAIPQQGAQIQINYDPVSVGQ